MGFCAGLVGPQIRNVEQILVLKHLGRAKRSHRYLQLSGPWHLGGARGRVNGKPPPMDWFGGFEKFGGLLLGGCLEARGLGGSGLQHNFCMGGGFGLGRWLGVSWYGTVTLGTPNFSFQ